MLRFPYVLYPRLGVVLTLAMPLVPLRRTVAFDNVNVVS